MSSVKKLGIYSVFAVTIQVSKGRTLALSRPDALEIRRDIHAAVKRTKRKQPMPVKQRTALLCR